MERHINVFNLIVSMLFIRLCTTSKCNTLTHNMSLYRREERIDNTIRGEERKEERYNRSSGGFRGALGAIAPIRKKNFRFFTAEKSLNRVHITTNKLRNSLSNQNRPISIESPPIKKILDPPLYVL